MPLSFQQHEGEVAVLVGTAFGVACSLVVGKFLKAKNKQEQRVTVEEFEENLTAIRRSVVALGAAVEGLRTDMAQVRGLMDPATKERPFSYADVNENSTHGLLRNEEFDSQLSNDLIGLKNLLGDLSAKIETLSAASSSAEVLTHILQTARETLATIREPRPTPTDLIVPLLRDVIRLVTNLEVSIKASADHPDRGHYEYLMLMLERYGAKPYAPNVGSLFLPSECRSNGEVPTAIRAEDSTIAEVVRSGWNLNETRLTFPVVIVKRFS